MHGTHFPVMQDMTVRTVREYLESAEADAIGEHDAAWSRFDNRLMDRGQQGFDLFV